MDVTSSLNVLINVEPQVAQVQATVDDVFQQADVHLNTIPVSSHLMVTLMISNFMKLSFVSTVYFTICVFFFENVGRTTRCDRK